MSQREPIPPPGPRGELFELLFLRNGVSVMSALPRDYKRVPVIAASTMQARAGAHLPGFYLVTLAKPGEVTLEERQARHREIEASVGKDERHDPIERYWGSFPA